MKRGQLLSERETKLFRAWALAPLSRVERTYDEDEVLMEAFQDRYEAEMAGKKGIVSGKAFWNEGDEGDWDDGEGVPVWT